MSFYGDPPDEEFKEFSRKIDKILSTSYSDHVTQRDLMEYEEILKSEGGDYAKVFTVTREQVDMDIRLIWEDLKLKEGLTDDGRERE